MSSRRDAVTGHPTQRGDKGVIPRGSHDLETGCSEDDFVLGDGFQPDLSMDAEGEFESIIAVGAEPCSQYFSAVAVLGVSGCDCQYTALLFTYVEDNVIEVFTLQLIF